MSADFKIEERFQRKKMTWPIFRRLFKYTWKYKNLFFMTILFAILGTASSLAGPHLINIGIKNCLQFNVPGSYGLRGLQIVCGLYFINMILGWLFATFRTRKSSHLGQTVLNDIRLDVFTHVQKLSMSYFDKTLQGRIIARADSDIETMEHVVTWGVGQFLISILTLIGVFMILLAYNVKLCLAVAIVIPILFYGTFLMKKYGMRAYRMIREGVSRITAGYAENTAGVRIVQSFVREEYNFADFLGLNRTHSRNVVKASIVWGGYQSMVGVLRGVSDLIVIGYGSYLFANGEIGIESLIVYVFYIHMFFEPIEMLGELYNATLSTAAAAERVFDLIDTPPSIVNRENAIELPRVQGNIEFKNVNFSYDGSHKWILKDINISIKKGSTVALVGPTGAGKTSFVNLIARFYENQEGSIQIDGHEIKDCSLHSLHSQISIVPQDSFLFTGTVNENIRYGMSAATDESIVEASKRLGAHSLISKLKDGYETKVKERGAGLSHGERQLICFTRAYISDPTILILDEATSAVDAHTEYIVHDAVHTMTKDRTTFIIAHRLSTARLADLILVIEDGRIAESGTHEELSSRNGSYSRLLKHYHGNLSE